MAALAVATALLLTTAVALGAVPDREVRSFGPAGNGEGRISPHAAGVAVAADGHVFVADTVDGRIERFDRTGAADGGWAAAAPTAVALDAEGRVLVGGADGVTAYSPDGAVLQHYAPMGPVGGVAAGGAGTVLATDRAAGEVVVFGPDGERAGSIGSLRDPLGVALGPDRAVYVSDAATRRVHRFGSDERSWPAGDARGLAVGADGLVHVAQGNDHHVGVYEPDGTPVAEIGPGARLNVPRGVAIDCRGSVYAVDNSDPRVHVFGGEGSEPPPCPPPPQPPEPTPTPAPQAEVASAVEEENPIIGRTTRATVLSGAVYAGRGARRRQLGARQMLPVGETIDATDGLVRLEFETTGEEDHAQFGRYMEGEFSQGEFTVHQARTDSLVELQLEDTGVGSPDAEEAVTSARRKRRRLWVRARGRFRTVGRHGAATVRGTRWLTEERAGGTYFRVVEGSVLAREFATGRVVVLRAPDSFLARRPCVSRRRFWIRLRIPVGTVVTGVRVSTRGRSMKVRRGRRLRALVDLRGIPEGRVHVRISVRTATGESLTGTRTYRTCAPQFPRPDKPPEL